MSKEYYLSRGQVEPSASKEWAGRVAKYGGIIGAIIGAINLSILGTAAGLGVGLVGRHYENKYKQPKGA